jgi:hypothetical protein
MDAASRYKVLSWVSGFLAALLLLGAILFRVIAIGSLAVVVLLIVATLYFISSAHRVSRQA